MAELAGMRPPERWSGWKREPFTSESDRARVGLGEAGSIGAPVTPRPNGISRGIERIVCVSGQHESAC
jgi:hypothetical protein